MTRRAPLPWAGGYYAGIAIEDRKCSRCGQRLRRGSRVYRTAGELQCAECWRELLGQGRDGREDAK